ncbi:type I-C CRISPR-associated protein Cas5c [Enterococcus sp. DIV0876]|uniref:type I-C CRISPR-associated protein Cas5c n=1 Tax=Enterococcus sp. DIV0876 TaxID=2774633 RepID=UPI003D2FF897
MKWKNQVTFKVYGDYGLFTDPTTKMGGEKMTYQVPTYQALKGITESIYWKPTLIYFIDEVRVINPIQMESKGIRPMKYNDSSASDLAYYTYLKNPCYEVKVHFEFNPHRPDLKNDWDEHKHFQILQRAIRAGGRRDIFLGTRECQGYVEAVDYGQEPGYYDNYESEIHFGTMVHGLSYPDETGEDQLSVRLWRPVMEKGIIRFIPPKECQLVRTLKPMKAKAFSYSSMESAEQLFSSLEKEEKL